MRSARYCCSAPAHGYGGGLPVRALLYIGASSFCWFSMPTMMPAVALVFTGLVSAVATSRDECGTLARSGRDDARNSVVDALGWMGTMMSPSSSAAFTDPSPSWSKQPRDETRDEDVALHVLAACRAFADLRDPAVANDQMAADHFVQKDDAGVRENRFGGHWRLFRAVRTGDPVTAELGGASGDELAKLLGEKVGEGKGGGEGGSIERHLIR